MAAVARIPVSYSFTAYEPVLPPNRTGIHPGNRVLITGGTPADRARAVAEFIRLSEGVFQKVVSARSVHTTPAIETLRGRMPPHDRALIVFYIDDPLQFRNRTVGDYIVRGRSQDITVILVTDRYTDVPRLPRSILNCVLLCGSRLGKTDGEAILADTGICVRSSLLRAEGFLMLHCNTHVITRGFTGVL